MKTDRFRHFSEVIAAGFLVGLCSWFLEAAVHSYVLRQGTFGVQVLYPPSGEVWHRLLLGVCFVGCGAYVQYLFAGRQKAKAEVRQTEEVSRVILENVTDGILIIDAETRKFVEVNGAMCAMLGYARDELLDLGIEDIHPPKDLPAVIREFERCIKSSTRLAENLPMKRKNGSVFFADIGHTTLALNGRTCAVGIFRDITERKSAEEETERLFQELAAKAVSLKESEARFRSIAEATVDIIYRLDPAGMVTYASPAIVQISGSPAENVTGRHFLEFVYPEDRPAARGAYQQLLEGKEVRSLDLRIVNKDGVIIHAELNIVPILRENTVIEIQGVIHDVTERRNLLTRLEEKTAEQNAILENTLGGIAMLQDRRFVRINSMMEQMFGYSRNEVAGLTTELFYPSRESYEQLGKEAYPLLSRGETYHAERLMKRKDGSDFWCSLSGKAVDPSDPDRGSIWILQDISVRKESEERIKGINEELERRVLERTAELELANEALRREIADRTRTETELRESWNRFRQLAENIREVFWIRDTATRRILYISPAYEELWGRTCRSLYDQPDSFLEPVHPDDAARVHDAVARLRDNEPFDQEFRIPRPDGSVRWIWARSFAIRNEDGAVIRQVGIAEDVTDRKNAEQMLRNHADRLQTLSTRLIAARETERQFIARELHDEIGQQLTGIKISLDMMSRAAPGAATAHLGETRAIVTDLLRRVRDLALDLRPSMLDDLGLLPTLTWHFDRYRSRTGVSVAFTHEGMEGRFGTSLETTLYRVIQESLTNVARHSGAKDVSVSLTACGSDIRLSIADNGGGFDTDKVSAQTMGLIGMRERIETVGGCLAIESASGAGTRVIATVPLQAGAGGGA